MRTYLLLDRLQELNKGRSGLRAVMLCAIVMLVAPIDATAGSTRCSATLHIQITVVSTLQESAEVPQNATQPGAVTFDLTSQNPPALTQQTTTRRLTSNQDRETEPRTPSAAEPAVLQTLTIVAQYSFLRFRHAVQL